MRKKKGFLVKLKTVEDSDDENAVDHFDALEKALLMVMNKLA